MSKQIVFLKVYIIYIKICTSGFVSNGEYNVFRVKGYSRPLSVLKIRSLVRNKIARMSVSKMEAMLCPVGKKITCTCICMGTYTEQFLLLYMVWFN